MVNKKKKLLIGLFLGVLSYLVLLGINLGILYYNETCYGCLIILGLINLPSLLIGTNAIFIMSIFYGLLGFVVSYLIYRIKYKSF